MGTVCVANKNRHLNWPPPMFPTKDSPKPSQASKAMPEKFARLSESVNAGVYGV